MRTYRYMYSRGYCYRAQAVLFHLHWMGDSFGACTLLGARISQ